MMCVLLGPEFRGFCYCRAIFARQNRAKPPLSSTNEITGGNCYDYTNGETSITVNRYGSHFFHTEYFRVWEYMCSSHRSGLPMREHTVLAAIATTAPITASESTVQLYELPPQANDYSRKENNNSEYCIPPSRCNDYNSSGGYATY